MGSARRQRNTRRGSPPASPPSSPSIPSTPSSVECKFREEAAASSKYVRYSGPLDCALMTIKSEGIRGILCGWLATLLRESIGTATFFSTYELSCYYMHLQLNSKSPAHSRLSKLLSDVGVGIVSGGIAGMALSLANHHVVQHQIRRHLFSPLSSFLQFWTVVLPFDVAKTIIQTAPDPNSTRNPFEILHSSSAKPGIPHWGWASRIP